MALIVMCGIMAQAQTCTSVVKLNVSSCPVTGNTYDSTVWHPLTISTNVPVASIYRVTISNSDPSVAQSVRLYEWGRIGVSSASVRLIWEDTVGGIPAYSVGSTTTTVVAFSLGPTLEYWGNDGRWPLIAKRGLAIQKSSPSSTINVSVQYR
jgi:hypothetical protein